jgi:hypothetical protein
MKKVISLASIILLFISSMASANQTIHVDQQKGSSPVLKWYSSGPDDNIQINPGRNNVYLLVKNNQMTNGHLSCHISITGCQKNLLGLAPGDSALCEPRDAVHGVQLVSTCISGEDPYMDASGSYQFLTK